MVRLKETPFAIPAQVFTYFNSTMVRLKEMFVKTATPMLFYFNSTMVRLKVGQKALKDVVLVFQFHNGAIKRNPKTLFHNRLHYFNSTMVRLKVYVLLVFLL